MKEDSEELLAGNVDEVRKTIRNTENPDYSELLELEKEGKDRKTIKKFLRPKIDSEDETPEDDNDSGSQDSMEGKVDQQLEELVDVQGIDGAAVVRRDGLLIAVKMDREIDENKIGAMTASTVGSGETASDALNMGEVDEVTIESDNGKLISTGAGEKGILTVLAEPGVNMGLVKVEIGSAVDKIRRVL